MAGFSLHPGGADMARIQEITLRSGATVTMHTRLSWREARELVRTRQNIAKIKDEDKKDFVALSCFVTGWTLRHVETGEPLEFDAASMPDVDYRDMGHIFELIEAVESGEDPNAPSASSPAT
jgi:hypothetical protein